MAIPTVMKESAAQYPVQGPCRSRHALFRMGLIWITLGVACASVSCRTTQVRRTGREEPPEWAYPVRHFAGSVLSGPTDVNLGPVGASDVCEVSVTWVAFERPAGLRFESLDQHARLIVTVPADQAVRPVARLTRGVRVLPGRDPDSALAELGNGVLGRDMVLARAQGVVPRGATVSFGIGDPNRATDPRASMAILVSRPTDGPQQVEWAVSVTGKIRTPDAGQGRDPGLSQAPAGPEAAPDWLTETVVTGRVTTADSSGWAVVLPSVLQSQWVRAVGAIVQVRTPAQGPALAAALDRLRSDLRARPAQDAAHPGSLRLEEAVRTLDLWPHWPKVLLNLADTLGAGMAKDLLLTAPYWVQYRVRNEVQEAAHGLQDPASAAWVLDRAAYRVLIDLGREGYRTPSLETLLLLHAGQVGRDPTLLDEILRQSTGLEDWNRRLVRENGIFLEDMSPAARCRALEWLAARGKAPAGFDPLAPAKQRRAALAAAPGLFE